MRCKQSYTESLCHRYRRRAELAAPSCPRPSVNGIENVIYLYSEAGGVMVNIVTVSHCSDLNVSVVGIIKFCILCVRF